MIVSRRLATLLALILAGCGSGGPGDTVFAPGADVRSAGRGVPVVMAVDDDGALAALENPGADEFVAVFVSPRDARGTVRIEVNGGGAELVPLPAPAGRSPGPRSRAADAERDFSFLGGAADVHAVLADEGDEALLYVDSDTPPAALGPADIDDLAAQLEQLVLPFARTTVGEPSDIDGNGAVTVLLTPRVVPPRFGFFFVGDLGGGGNAADMIYMRVPRPDAGEPYQTLRPALLATLVHELQHLISYRYKQLDHQLGAEASWLNEGLSFLAEDLAGLLDTAGGSPENVFYYFASPERYTLLETSGVYDDGHAGAGYLFCRYLADRFGEGIVRRLVQSGRRGVANVEAETGVEFATLVTDWAAAVLLTGTGLNSSARYTIPGFAARGSSFLGGAIELDGPRATAVDAANGAPAFAFEMPRGALRLVRLTNPRPGGTEMRVAAADVEQVRVVFVRVPKGV